jgi:hypothetical protein
MREFLPYLRTLTKLCQPRSTQDGSYHFSLITFKMSVWLLKTFMSSKDRERKVRLTYIIGHLFLHGGNHCITSLLLLLLPRAIFFKIENKFNIIQINQRFNFFLITGNNFLRMSSYTIKSNAIFDELSKISCRLL